LAKHRKEHVLLVEEVLSYQRRFHSGESMAPELLHFLRDWLVNHILGIDQRYSATLVEKGVQ
jgi:hemerythrin-like metal-binding protein